jgi:hypothetical protein
MLRYRVDQLVSTLVLALGFSSWASAQCYIGEATNAMGVQEDSGQGNYDCSVLTTPDGAPMENLLEIIPSLAGFEPMNDGTGTIKWHVNGVDTNDDGIPDERNNVYLVSTFNKGQGKRCNYLYKEGVASGDGLGAMNSGSVETVTICGEPTADPLPPPETGIVTTLGEECLATFNYDGSDEGGTVPAVSFGLTAGSTELVAACSSSSEATIDLGLGQTECAPPPAPLRTPVPPAGGDCHTPYVDGSYPLSCAPVEWDAGELKYCWYYENRVCEVGVSYPETHHCYLRGYDGTAAVSTYVPKTKVSTFDISVDVHDGSTCYTYYLRGKAYYSCY